jgi:hypothetical protein
MVVMIRLYVSMRQSAPFFTIKPTPKQAVIHEVGQNAISTPRQIAGIPSRLMPSDSNDH